MPLSLENTAAKTIDIMERDFYSDEFEDLIREKTDQLKMYPSEKVWKEIHGSLHTRRRRYVIGMSLLISGIFIVAGKQLLAPAKHQRNPASGANIAAVTKSTNDEPVAVLSPFVKQQHRHTPIPLQTEADQQENLDGLSTTEKLFNTDSAAAEASTAQPAPGAEFNSNGAVESNNIFSPSAIKVRAERSHLQAPEGRPLELATNTVNQALKANVESARENTKRQFLEEDQRQSNWLAERALEHLTPLKQHKLNWQVYFSPTLNYRTLTGGDYTNSRSIVQNVPISLVHYGTANDFVDHTPAVAFEAGGAIQYRLTRNLTIKGGLQFNYSRYFIRAFSSSPELATIALNPYYGVFADSITGYTSVRNFSGKSKEYLQNRYYELSAPIGVELRVLGNGKLQFNLGGTIQPSYLLNGNSYLLTTDYTNYTKEPSLFRRWNVSGGLEAFVSYQIGGLRWQIGPQFRYQLFSTYSDKYPLKENLKEYGIKLGISKTIR